MHQWVLTGVDKSALDLRDKTVLVFQPSDVQSVDVALGSDHFMLKRAPAGKWDLVEGGKTAAADVPVVERLLDEVRDLKGVSIIADPMQSPVPFGLDQPAITVSLTGKDGKPIGTMKLAKISVKPTGAPEPGESAGPRTEYYATSTAGNAVYSVSDFSFSQLNKPPALFRAKVEASPSSVPTGK